MNIIKTFFLVSIIFYGCKSELPTDNIDGNTDISTDTIYIGGHFTIAENQSIKNIAFWDGENWNSLGTGITGRNTDVESMAFYKGELYVGGFIDSAGGIPSQNIAKWDGKNWSAVGDGINGRVTDIIVYKNTLYAAGWFSSAGGLRTDNIAKWDGITWSSVGEGFSDEVYTLCVYNDELYAGGWFTKNSSGYFNANNIAKWNSTNWDTVGSGVNSGISGGSWIKTLTVFNNELYASGNFSKSGNLKVSNIARWNNSIWQSVDDGTISNRTYTSVEYKNELHLAGESDSNDSNTAPYYAVWNGTNWNFSKFSLDGSPYYLYSFGDYLYVGGAFHSVNGNSVNGIFKWDGTSIHNFGSGVQGYVSSILSQ